MARLLEQMLIVKISELVRDDDMETKETLPDDFNKNLETVIAELYGVTNAMVEVSANPVMSQTSAPFADPPMVFGNNVSD